MESSKFTCIKFQFDNLITADSGGFIVSWDLKPSEEPAPTVIARLGNEIVDLEVYGNRIVCRTCDDNFFQSYKRSRFGEFEIVDFEFVNQIPCPEIPDEFDSAVDYGLNFEYQKPLLLRYMHKVALDYIDIETNEEISELYPSDYDMHEILYRDGFIAIDEYLVGTRNIWIKDTEEKIVEFESCITEHIEMSGGDEDDFYYNGSWIYPVSDHPCKVAFVEDWVTINQKDEVNDMFLVRVGVLNLDGIRSSYDIDLEFDQPIRTYKFRTEWRSCYDFKIKRTEANDFAFSENIMATLTDSGAVKIYNYVEKELLSVLNPYQKSETNDFGEIS